MLKRFFSFYCSFYRFLIGRENNSENSEIAQLISQSIQADKEQQKTTVYQVMKFLKVYSLNILLRECC